MLVPIDYSPLTKIVCVDPSPGMLSNATEFESRVTPVLSDALTFTEAAEIGSFEAVYSMECVHHFSDELGKIATNVFRILEDGGKFVIQKNGDVNGGLPCLGRWKGRTCVLRASRLL